MVGPWPDRRTLGGMTHIECPLHDWAEDVEDPEDGYVDLYVHEQELHTCINCPAQ